MNYLEWNSVIAQHLFRDTRKGQEVFLCLSEDELVKAVITAADKSIALLSVRQLATLDKERILADFWRALKRGPGFWGTSLPNGQQEDPIDGKPRPAPCNPAEYARYSWYDWKRGQFSPRLPGVRILNYRDRDVRFPKSSASCE